jgi:hypothetical protein
MTTIGRSTLQSRRAFGEDDLTPGDLETDAAAVLDPALDKLVASLQPDGLQTRALPPDAMLAAATAVALAKQARAETDIQRKIVIATAASYSAAFFGLPRNNLLYVIDEVCGMFAMTAYQRRQYHQEAARFLDSYVASLKKGNGMSGVFKDGSLGILMHQNGAFQDGSLGQNGAYRDGSLGRTMYQNGAFQDGSLGAGWASTLHRSPTSNSIMRQALRRRSLRGLGGGCGCSGMGDDAATVPAAATAPAPELAVDATPFYKKPIVIGGAAIALGVVLYAVSRK